MQAAATAAAAAAAAASAAAVAVAAAASAVDAAADAAIPFIVKQNSITQHMQLSKQAKQQCYIVPLVHTCVYTCVFIYGR